MIPSGANLQFIYGAWGGVVVATVLLIAWIWLEAVRTRRAVAALEANLPARPAEPTA
ncbi:MAG: hypothetical protein JWR75_1624 [Devosia sp.]|nr:hypothetical protein [Devosia sp.]